jgi:hypothetical protein
MRRTGDFENNVWLSFEKLLPATLWTLDVPAALVRWCSLDKQCRNTFPLDQWFYDSEDIIRDFGEVPMALVESPISCRHVVGQRDIEKKQIFRPKEARA